VLFTLKNNNILVTGASGAIGRAIAMTFANCGANIVISGTKKDVLLDIGEYIAKQSGVVPHVLPCDLTNSSEVCNLISDAVSLLGGLDVLINNAGINKDMLLGKMSEKDLNDVLKVNLNASFILSKDAISIMSNKRYGRIINISSVVGFTGNIGQVNYCASKAAIVGMSKAMALEVARKGITINCVAPGAINSPMMEKLSDTNKERFLTQIPMKRIGDPIDVAYACCFLASREASYITGQTIHVNGGMFTT
jgi:3-oxoacyl-[acyl-carrier protein] reductase